MLLFLFVVFEPASWQYKAILLVMVIIILYYVSLSYIVHTVVGETNKRLKHTRTR